MTPYRAFDDVTFGPMVCVTYGGDGSLCLTRADGARWAGTLFWRCCWRTCRHCSASACRVNRVHTYHPTLPYHDRPTPHALPVLDTVPPPSRLSPSAVTTRNLDLPVVCLLLPLLPDAAPSGGGRYFNAWFDRFYAVVCR